MTIATMTSKRRINVTFPIEVLELVDDVLDELGTRKEVEYLHTILEGGSSADRQLATYRRSGDLIQVVDQLVEESRPRS